MKIDPYYQRRRYSPMTVDSGNVRFMGIFAGFSGEEASNNSGVIENIENVIIISINCLSGLVSLSALHFVAASSFSFQQLFNFSFISVLTFSFHSYKCSSQIQLL